MHIRLLSKLAAESEVRGDEARRTAVYTSVHDDSSTESTKQFTLCSEFRKRSTKGFTLIEVLIALAILAISLTALLKTTHEVLNGSNQIKEKSIKHWIAMQAITKVQLGNIRPQLGRETTYATKVFHKQWHVRIKTKTTSIPHLQKIIVDISSNQYGPFTEQLMAFYYE